MSQSQTQQTEPKETFSESEIVITIQLNRKCKGDKKNRTFSSLVLERRYRSARRVEALQDLRLATARGLLLLLLLAKETT
jgi:hypothetical protein